MYKLYGDVVRAFPDFVAMLTFIKNERPYWTHAELPHGVMYPFHCK